MWYITTPFSFCSILKSLMHASFSLDVSTVGYYDVMSPFFLLCLLLLFILPHSSFSSHPQGYFLDCGGSENVTVGSLNYVSDKEFINVGKNITIKADNLVPILSTLRYFPDKKARKYCYSIPVTPQGKYLVRTIFYYGRFDGGNEPPVFDQIVEGTKWNIVNTTEDFAKGLSSYFEVVVMAFRKDLSVCLARNNQTGSSSPFISALEVEALDASVYNPTNFTKYDLVNPVPDIQVLQLPYRKLPPVSHKH